MRLAVTLVCLLATSASATADPKAELAKAMRVSHDAILDVQDFRLDAPPYHRAIVGHYKHGDVVTAGAALVWCDHKQRCWIAAAHLRGGGDIEVFGLVDLAGPPKPFPSHRLDARYTHHALKLPARAKWPALVIRRTTREQHTTTSRYGGPPVTGVHRQRELYVLSLAREDVARPQVLHAYVEDIWPTGAGHTTTFAVAKDGSLVATEQRHLENKSMCLRPKPTTTHYLFDREHRRFKRSNLPQHTGCR